MQGDVFGQVEYDHQRRFEIADRGTMHGFHAVETEIAGDTLKGAARIGVTVADHPASAGQRRPHGIAQVCAACRVHQQQFGHVVPLVRLAAHQQTADFLGGRTAARLAGQNSRNAGSIEGCQQAARLHALAGAVDTIDDDHAIVAAVRLVSRVQFFLRRFNW